MRRLLAVGFAAALLACGSSDSSGPAADVTGTYTITSAGGHAVPATLFSAGTTQIILVSGALTVNANHTWTASLLARDVENGVATDNTQTTGGTWTQSGNTITFTDTSNGGSDQFSATVSSNTLTSQIDFDFPIGVVTVVLTK